MNELKDYLKLIIEDNVLKIVISKPILKSNEYKKIVIEKKGNGYQVSQYTEKQVFHINLQKQELLDKCVEIVEQKFRQVNAWSNNNEHIILISKKGSCNYKKSIVSTKNTLKVKEQHNRKKKYILEEGMKIEPLVDMGVFSKEGKIINSMYGKYRQINRFLEILNDEISKVDMKEINIIDFGCGKSYLTFVVYYYLTEIMKINVNMIGLDLKKDVIVKCNEAAKKYGYDKLKFEVGDINGFKTPFSVDMVITLHACDTATDYALYNAIQWGASMIFSVPCCQHELNKQIQTEDFSILTRYGIIKERFTALATDAIRGNLLEYCGYKTQLLEFIDFEHTPKNILIRAVKRPLTPKSLKIKAIKEVESIKEEFNFKPTLYELLEEKINI